MQRRRDGLLLPHNNKGIHGHPAPHQSTDRGVKDGGEAGWVSKREESKDAQGGRERGQGCPRRQRWTRDGRQTVERLKQRQNDSKILNKIHIFHSSIHQEPIMDNYSRLYR